MSEQIDRLLRIMATLRDPVSGCDWDRAQRFETIVPHTIEEAYEVADAVSRGDLADIRELGDLAERLPPDAHLPVFVVRGADLRAPDQRIAQLTAHRHSFGLQLENCLIDLPCMDVLTQGAQRALAAGYPGLRVLGCTHAQAVAGLMSPA